MRITITRCGVDYGTAKSANWWRYWFTHAGRVRASRLHRFVSVCFGLYFMLEWGVK